MKNKIENRTNLKKDLFWNTLGSTLNAFTSLFYMIIITRINGINDAGIFTFAFSTATLFYMIGIYAGRVFQVTDNTNTSDIWFSSSQENEGTKADNNIMILFPEGNKIQLMNNLKEKRDIIVASEMVLAYKIANTYKESIVIRSS